MYIVLYNPLCGNGHGQERVMPLRELLKDQELTFTDIREIRDYQSFLNGIAESDSLVLAGGDGTLNKFVNFTYGMTYPKNLFYYATGSGNDFKHDVDPRGDQMLIPLAPYLTALPTVTVKGKTYRFINGIGYGIDGYCCEVGDAVQKKSDKPVNYTSIAIKGLLFHYKPTRATVTVDGKVYEFDKVWLAPTMIGRFYSGGMMIAPEQDRLNQDRSVSVVSMHNSGKLKTLRVFPSIFKGEHISHKEMIDIYKGHRIKVAFDRPVALQIDGETVPGVTEYTVSAAVDAAKINEAELVRR